MTSIKLKPAPGLIVPNPATGRPLEASGETVERTVYWQRRIEDEDVLVVAGKSKEA